MNASDELLAVFRAEVQEQLELIIAALDEDPEKWDLQELFRLSHNIKGAARMVNAMAVRDAAHALEDLFASLRDGATCTPELAALAREGCFILETSFDMLDAGEGPDLGRFRDDLSTQLSEEKGSVAEGKPVAPSAPQVPSETKDGASSAPDNVGAKPADHASPAATDTIRVGVERIDNLMGFATEFVSTVGLAQQHRQIAADVLSAITKLERKPDLAELAELRALKQLSHELHRSLVQDGMRHEQLSTRFQDSLRSLRMIRVDSIGTVLKKVVRDTARATGRDAGFFMEGGGTEMDRAALDGLRDPLIHLIRNAIAHGIETPDERARSGKAETGTVTMSVSSKGTWVEILISDDGGGIDIERVRNVAAAKGVVTAQQLAAMSEEEVCDLVFRPGFSSVTEVTEVSGRGVGLDIVRKNVIDLGGHVAMESRRGSGTTFHLLVPLTRLTTNGILIRIGKQYFALPTAGVERVAQVSRDDISEVDGKDVLPVAGEMLPVSSLEQALKVTSDGRPYCHALVLSGDGRRRAFLADEVLGEKEFVIQRLNWNLKHVPAVMGCAVIAGGKTVFILNSNELLGTRMASSLIAARGSHRAERLKRILVVDDSVTSRTLVHNILASAGYDVQVAVDGEKAWSELLDSEFDLVVSDVEMPHLDGLGLTERIRSNERSEHLPVILVTSMGKEEHKRRGAEAGANAYIVKGVFDQDELLAAVGRLL